MNMFEEAKSIYVMMKMRNLTQNETAKMLGVSQSYVANKLRLLSIDEPLRKQITDAKLTERHARALLRLKSSEDQQKALDTMCGRRLSVAESEALIDLIHMTEAPKAVGQADRLRCIDTFLKTTKQSLITLSSLGVNATQNLSYHGNKILLTISIDEG